jgi:hypothetical protein
VSVFLAIGILLGGFGIIVAQRTMNSVVPEPISVGSASSK